MSGSVLIAAVTCNQQKRRIADELCTAAPTATGGNLLMEVTSRTIFILSRCASASSRKRGHEPMTRLQAGIVSVCFGVGIVALCTAGYVIGKRVSDRWWWQHWPKTVYGNPLPQDFIVGIPREKSKMTAPPNGTLVTCENGKCSFVIRDCWDDSDNTYCWSENGKPCNGGWK